MTAIETWDDSIGVDHLWTNANLGEAVPDVMTPATWSVMAPFVTRALASTTVPGVRFFGRIAGRLYLDLSVIVATGTAFGLPVRRVLATAEPIFGTVPADVEIPVARLPRLRTITGMIGSQLAGARRARALRGELDGWLGAVPQRCAALHTSIAAASTAAELHRLWTEIDPLFTRVGELMEYSQHAGQAQVRTPARLTKLVGATDAAALVAAGADLESLGPVLGLAELHRGDIDWPTFVRRHGHRGPHEFELSVPRPAEDPGWRNRQPVVTAADPHALMARREERRAEAWERLVRRHPRRAGRAQRDIDAYGVAVRTREHIRSEAIRVFGVIRAFVLRAGGLTGIGDDAFFLALPELLLLLDGREPGVDVAVRRATYEHYVALAAPPPLVRGSHAGAAAGAGDAVSGIGASAGVAEGPVRVLTAADDDLEPGEVLVTATTNVGWTPLFPRAAAVVTDVGARLSHAAIVARELGIPAVVGCGNATTVLRTGDVVRVDGEAGTVEVIRPRQHPSRQHPSVQVPERGGSAPHPSPGR